MREYKTAWRATFHCACGAAHNDWSVGNVLICGICGRGRETFQRTVSREVHRKSFSDLFTGRSSLVATEYLEGETVRAVQHL